LHKPCHVILLALPKIEVVKAVQSTAAASRVERLHQHGDKVDILKLFTTKNLSFSLWKTPKSIKTSKNKRGNSETDLKD
jgi:hypothetical protein